MSKQFTPGPWRVGDDATGKPLTVWAAEPGRCVTSVLDDRLGRDAPPIANARLVAAAPEMYEALTRYIATYADTQTHPTPTQEALVILATRSALKRVRGFGDGGSG